MPRKIFQEWWESQTHGRNFTQEDTLLDFIDAMICDGKITRDDFMAYLSSIYEMNRKED